MISELKSLTAKAKMEVIGAINMSSFQFTLIAAFWFRILIAIHQRNQIIQAQNATIDIKVRNLEDLQVDLKTLRNQWPSIYEKANVVTTAMGIHPFLPELQTR